MRRGKGVLMGALTDVYQLTYAGRDVLIGDEITTLDGAAKFVCGTCGGALFSRWLEGAEQKWFIVCPECGPAKFVRRYYTAMRGDGSLRPARLGGSNRKASAEIMRQYGHHPRPFESVEVAKAELAKEQEAMDSVAGVLEMYQALEQEG